MSDDRCCRHWQGYFRRPQCNSGGDPSQWKDVPQVDTPCTSARVGAKCPMAEYDDGTLPEYFAVTTRDAQVIADAAKNGLARPAVSLDDVTPNKPEDV